MKVGDLITLSSYGQSLVMLNHRKNKVGFVIEKLEKAKFQIASNPPTADEYIYKIQWLCIGHPTDNFPYHRRDIKRVKEKP